MFHFAYDFLTISERQTVFDEVCPWLQEYTHLRKLATYTSVHHLRSPRQVENMRPGIDDKRVLHLAVALYRFQFDYPDLIRWLGGVYTYAHRDWNAVYDILHMVRDRPIPSGYPKVDINHAMDLLRFGAPLEMHHSCTYQDLARREAYDNHPPIIEAIDEILRNFSKEEQLSYQLLLPRFIWRFINGLHISPINWVTQPGKKGRFCLDPTSHITRSKHTFGNNLQPRPPPVDPSFISPKYHHCTDGVPTKKERGLSSPDGAPNDMIPNTGADGAELMNPKVYYATAFRRFLIWIWRLRIEYPTTDILLLADDISAAFRQVLYHPRIALAFGSVLTRYLIIPTSLIFGAKNSPSLYMIPAEVRAHLAATLHELSAFVAPLAQQLSFPLELSAQQRLTLVRATPDSHHGPLSTSGGNRQPSFVDDTGNAGIPTTIRSVVNNSVISAYILFGFPNETSTRQPVINPHKWIEAVLPTLHYLGFQIESRPMTVTWPIDKREKLAKMFDDSWLHGPKPILTPRQISQPLGLIRNGSIVSVFGIAFSLLMQYRLTDELRRSLKVKYVKGRPTKPGKRWWSLARIPIPADVIAGVRILRSVLLDPKYEHIWCRPIGHLVPRDANLTSYGDASYSGLGGYSVPVKMMWRLCRQDLVNLGYPMFSGEPAPGTKDKGIHINILEFLALIIGIWFTLRIIANKSTDIIYIAYSDNTSALSWLKAAARATNPVVRRYARFLQALIATCPFPFSMQGLHVIGKENEDADLASRPERAPTWQSVIDQVSLPVKSCLPYQVPLELLMPLQKLLTEEETGEWYVAKTTKLWTVEPKTLSNGWLACVSTPIPYSRCKKTK